MADTGAIKEAMPTLAATQDQVSDTTAEDNTPQKRGLLDADRIKQVISRKDVHFGFFTIVLASLATAFRQYTGSVYTAYATSAFKSHSDLATAAIVSRALDVVTYLLLPKIADNVGRMSPILLGTMLLFTILRDAMLAGCKNVQTYIGAMVFDGIASSGWSILIQIYIAESTTIVSRAFWNTFPEAFGNVIALYSGTEIGGLMLSQHGTADGWRWGYGMFTVILFVCCSPFIATLASWHRRANRDPNVPPLPKHKNFFHQLIHEYDIVSCCLFGASVALILVPITIAKGVSSKWDASNIAMICVGFGLLILFIIWCQPAKRRPSFLVLPEFPLVPWHTLRNSTVLAICTLQFFDFMSYAAFTIYFQSYLQVAVRVSPAKASQIDNTLRIVFQVFAIGTGSAMKFWTPLCRRFGLGTKYFHTKYPVRIGVLFSALAIGLDIDFVQHPHRKSAIASFVVAKALYGVGRGMFQTATQVLIQNAAKRGDLGVATGIFYVSTSLGGAIGTAIAGALWNNLLPSALLRELPAETKSLARKIFGSIAVAITYDPSSGDGIAINTAYCYVFKRLAIAATCLQIPMLVAAWCIKDLVLDDKDEQNQAASKHEHESEADTSEHGEKEKEAKH